MMVMVIMTMTMIIKGSKVDVNAVCGKLYGPMLRECWILKGSSCGEVVYVLHNLRTCLNESKCKAFGKIGAMYRPARKSPIHF